MIKSRNQDSIALRIKKLRKDKKFSQTFVAQILSITQAAYSRIENSTNRIIAEHIIELSSLYKVTTDYILKGNDRLVEASFNSGFLPLIAAKAHAGFVENFNERINYDDRDWFKIPGFNPTKDQRLFEVEGESMVPTIFPGDVLVCQVQPSLDKILNGALILLVTDKEVVSKRFDRLEKEKIFLLNDNPDYPVQRVHINLSEVQQALMIRGKVTSVLIPGHQVISYNKVKELEESIEFLKNEILSLHKMFQRTRNRD